MMTVDEQLAYLTRGCVDVVRLDELRGKLQEAAKSGRPLVVKAGFDPTAPDLHLGHTVLIRKMKHFQDLGHHVVFVIGDFTALIGDPSGASKTRPALTPDEVQTNAATYRAQVVRLLDPDRTAILFNSHWLQPLSSEQIVRLTARYSVAQMLERRDFRQRYDSNRPIAIHEFLYPLIQAYDSVYLKADVELGGTDQLFNLNVGRDVMPAYQLPPQIVMTIPLLKGLDGVEKMSKSLGNVVRVLDTPAEMFGKLMSIPDELMWEYYTLLTDVPTADIAARQASVAAGALHPKEAKIALASAIVTSLYSEESAAEAAREFERVVVRKEAPSDMPLVEYRVTTPGTTLERLLVDQGLATSMSEAGRKIQQGAVRLGGEKFLQARWSPVDPQEVVVSVGRKAFRLKVIA